MYLEHKKASWIRIVSNGDISKNERCNQYFEWLINKAENFQEVFTKYIPQKKLDLHYVIGII
jgi:hypothetical protein